MLSKSTEVLWCLFQGTPPGPQTLPYGLQSHGDTEVHWHMQGALHSVGGINMTDPFKPCPSFVGSCTTISLLQKPVTWGLVLPFSCPSCSICDLSLSNCNINKQIHTPMPVH